VRVLGIKHHFLIFTVIIITQPLEKTICVGVRFLLRDMWLQFLKYFRPSNLFMGFGFVLAEWHRSDAKNRALLLLLFAPMFVCMFGFAFSLASFVFAFVSRLLGWFLLTALFGGGGVFFYEKLRDIRPFSSERSSSYGAPSSAYDAADIPGAARNPEVQDSAPPEREAKWKKWFDKVRK
jgi:hypothetical protein